MTLTYIAYTALNLSNIETSATAHPQHHRISVEHLAPDYLSSTQQNSGFIAGNVESPSVFKRNGVYYLLFDNTCAFCSNGSGVRVYTSAAPLGPYKFAENINVRNNAAEDGSAWTLPGTGRINTTLNAQQTHVAKLGTTSGTLYMWMGDRWGSAPDGVKGHDFQVWVPLEFDDDGVVRPLIRLNRWWVTLSLPPQPAQSGAENNGNSR